jgi:hypothetical protein
VGLFRREKTLNETLLEEADLQPIAVPIPTRVEASDHALNFIHEHGGRVYVWSDQAGLSHTETKPPDNPVDFVQLEATGFEFFQDATIASPTLWKLIYVPVFHHVDALYDGASWHGSTLGDG